MGAQKEGEGIWSLAGGGEGKRFRCTWGTREKGAKGTEGQKSSYCQKKKTLPKKEKSIKRRLGKTKTRFVEVTPVGHAGENHESRKRRGPLRSSKISKTQGLGPALTYA